MKKPTIRIVPPRGYGGTIKPLYGHAGRPIPRVPIPDIEDRPDCAACRSHACAIGRCDWSERRREEVRP